MRARASLILILVVFSVVAVAAVYLPQRSRKPEWCFDAIIWDAAKPITQTAHPLSTRMCIEGTR